MEDKVAVVTNHAVKRIRERVGVNKRATENLARKALKDGLSHKDLSGNLRRYVDSVFFRSRTANNLKVLHDKVYIFKNNVLITVISLPQNLAKVALKIKNRRKEDLKNDKEIL